jgi:enoyl-CoA hydratase/carnithine racemase
MYDMPEEIDVKADGPLRIITLNRPDALNAVNDALHVGLAKLWDALNEDADARAAVITGAGRAFRQAAISTTSTSCAAMTRCEPRPSNTAATS